jgi:hypothetical protein
MVTHFEVIARKIELRRLRNHRRAFARCGGDTLGRTGARIAGRKYARLRRRSTQP